MKTFKTFSVISILICLLMIVGCSKGEQKTMTKENAPTQETGVKTDIKKDAADTFEYFVEQFADIRIGRFMIPGFEQLQPKQKEMIYYLYQAALSGRDIYWDQNYKHNLSVRKTIEAIVKDYKGDRQTENFNKFMVYAKRVWFSNGIHHHYSTDKFIPDFPETYFKELIVNTKDGKFPLAQDQTLDAFADVLIPIIYKGDLDPKGVCTDTGKDQVMCSAANFYDQITQKEVEAYYDEKIVKDDPTPISYGLNSRLVKEDGKIVEKVWKIGGLYSPAIEKIVYWLEKAVSVAENDTQKKVLTLLIDYYKTGDLKVFDQYNIEWIKDTESTIDTINGFIETYGDALGFRATYEAVVSFKDFEATKRVNTISENAGWFEQNSSTDPAHKKKEIKGISARVITVAGLGGATAPNPPLGINLPNANWIRALHGSKSVTLGNISSAYRKMSESSGVTEEYSYSQEEIDLYKQYGELADDLHTDLHEIVGHGSGKINEGVGSPKETLKSYAATIEETRADLVAYYFIMDPKLTELGLTPNSDVGKVALSRAVRNGFMQQLTRVKLGDTIEQTHMRNRQLIAKWAYELGQSENVIEKKIKDGKTYFVVNDHQKLRNILGVMLKEIQRIKSEGDYEAAKKLIETHAVKIDQELHKEVLDRYARLNVAPYSGFICPVLVPVEKDGNIVDVKVEYPKDFVKQMLFYGETYSFLPVN